MVGCPVRDRAWVLPFWKKYLEQAIPDGVDLHLAFVADRGDTETIDLINSWRDYPVTMAYSDLKYSPYDREWNEPRYGQMVDLRNQLLGIVREHEPDFFLSLDSDILLHPDAISSMLTLVGRADAIGGLTYLNPTDTRVVSAGSIRNGMLDRSHIIKGEIYTIDVVMAIVMMCPQAYNIDYEPHAHGEDLGWSIAAKNAGLNLMFDGRVFNPHVWSRDWLSVVVDKLDKEIACQ